jgi:hypothetical protein
MSDFEELRIRGDADRKAADESETPHLRKHSRAILRGLPVERMLNGAIVRIDEWDEARQQHLVFICQMPDGSVCPVPTEFHMSLCNLEPIPEEARDDEHTYRQAVEAADTILDLLRTCDGTDYEVANKIMFQKNMLCNFGDLTIAKGVSRLLSHLAFLVECACEYAKLAPAFEQGRARTTEPKLDGCVVFQVRPPSAGGQEAMQEYDRCHRRWFYRSFGACVAIDAISHHVRVRKKVAYSLLLPLLAEWICNPACHWTTLEIPLHLAGTLLQFTTTRQPEVHLANIVQPFFSLCPGVRERIASVAKEDPDAGPVEYARRLDMWREVAKLPEGELFYVRKLIALWEEEEYSLHGKLDQEEACSAAKCMNIATLGVNSESGTFQVCSRCRCARYCSRECQRWDWKHGGHKQECVAVQKLVNKSTV